ncbi:hypothetical protein GC175_26085 [bacterium]|nr:hypothetical protein [bacterium]
MPNSMLHSQQSSAQENDPLAGRDVDDLDLAELQKLVDRVYEELRRELLLERERMGLTVGWTGRRH